MLDAVLGYHMSAMTCGVAKFNHALAGHLRVPCDSVNANGYKHPLVSIKPSEMPYRANNLANRWKTYDLLLHDRTLPKQCQLFKKANRVLYADEVGCPSTINGDPTRGRYRVLVFGMAHKLVLPKFERLKARLDADHPDYTVELSTAVHEGSPWDQALQESVCAMRRIFGDRLRVLGFLADDALARLMQEVDAVAVFYEPALRANNTSAWAALEAGKTLYTNRDAQSPREAVKWDRVLERIRA